MSLSDYIKEQEEEVVANATAELDQKISDLFTSAIDEPITDEKIEEFAEENGTTSEEVKAKAFALLTNLLVNGKTDEEEESVEGEEPTEEDEDVEESTKIVKEDADDASRVNGFRLYTLNPEFTKWIQSDELSEVIGVDELLEYLDDHLPKSYAWITTDVGIADYILDNYRIDIGGLNQRTKDEYFEYFESAIVAEGNSVIIFDKVLLDDYIEDGSLNKRKNESYRTTVDMISEGLKSIKI